MVLKKCFKCNVELEVENTITKCFTCGGGLITIKKDNSINENEVVSHIEEEKSLNNNTNGNKNYVPLNQDTSPYKKGIEFITKDNNESIQLEQILNWTGYSILIFGFVGGTVLGTEFAKGFDDFYFPIALASWLSSFFTSLVLFSASKIIKLLTKISHLLQNK